MKQLLKAIDWAARKHTGQRRKNAAASPYINHPLEVIEVMARIGNIDDESLLCAGVLHDTVEDTDAVPEDIEREFGAEIRAWVMECTDDKSLEKAERKRLQIVNAPHKSNGAKIIKTADKITNLRSLLEDPPEWAAERKRAYFEWAAQVLAGLRGANQALDAAAEKLLERGRCELS